MRPDSAIAETVHCSSADADTLALSGALIFATAAQALQEGSRALDGRSHLDLARVTRADSAGLACVLALVAQASCNGRKLTVLNLPEGLRALARLCDVESLLVQAISPLAGRSESPA